jgi:hypothetical protein
VSYGRRRSSGCRLPNTWRSSTRFLSGTFEEVWLGLCMHGQGVMPTSLRWGLLPWPWVATEVGWLACNTPVLRRHFALQIIRMMHHLHL